ncbi:hypothetical protein [Dietzia sp. SYD-A1]|uniref:hypothetical protein n=1 Tax=Dietzia sp. SYD-A1 TaxID=2780141 RepID=UPI001891128E|nr:hypothetical protein [Dietzia sp. SYD-A1]
MRLEILLASEMVIGTVGTSSPLVDIDTVCDEFGLPEIPATRLSSRLRDAMLAIIDRPGDDEETGEARRSTAARLLGMPEAIGSSRLVTVDTARLPDTYRSSVAALADGLARTGARQWVVEQCRSTHLVRRVQTRSDKDRGPVPETMRVSAAVREGTVLYAPVSWKRPPRDDEWELFEQVVGALRQVGGGESNGWGLVTCRIDGTRPVAAPVAAGQERGAR